MPKMDLARIAAAIDDHQCDKGIEIGDGLPPPVSRGK